MEVIKSTYKGFKKLSFWFCVVAGIPIFLMMAITVTDGILRFGGSSLRMALEIVETTLIIVVFGALTYTEIKDKHVRTTILIDRLGEKANRILRIIGHLLSAIVLVLWIKENFEYTVMMTEIKKTALSSILPYWPFCWVAVLGMVMLFIAYIFKLILLIGNVKEGD